MEQCQHERLARAMPLPIEHTVQKEQVPWAALLPVFRSKKALAASSEWQIYLDKVYGFRSLEFPIDMRGFLVIYWDIAPHAFRIAVLAAQHGHIAADGSDGREHLPSTPK